MASVRGVIEFEIFRNLRRKTFWFAAIAPPILILAIVGVTHVSSQSASSRAQQQSSNITKNSNIAVFDETGVVNTAALAKVHISVESSKQDGITAVQNGSLTAFIYYPRNVTATGIQVYGQDQGINNATPYNGLATTLLVDSAKAKAVAAIHSSQVIQILESAPNVTSTTYKNGQQTNDEADLIVPGIFLIAFLALVVLQAYLMITSTTEEKENRTAEILLTSIRSQTLITGKILSLFILGVVQLLVIIVPLLIAYAIFRQHISLPGGITLSQIPLDAKAVTFGLLFFVFGVVLFTGYLVGFGSLFPSAQEAGRYLGMSIIAAFLPIYAIGFIIDNTHSLIINVFTYFPLTAPTTLLIRNAIGTISAGQALTSLVVIIIFAVLAILFAMKAFRYSAMEYGRRVSVKELFR